MDSDLTCSELVELVTEYLDGGLATGDATRKGKVVAGIDDVEGVE